MTHEYPSAPDLEITTSEEGDASLLVVVGEVDASSADELRGAVVQALTVRPAVIIDLAGVTFMDSSGLSVLTHARSQADERGGALTLRSPSSCVTRLLEITGLAEHFLGTDS